MKRWAQVIGLEPDRLDEYRAYHKNIWPEVVENLKQAHIHNYSIHYAGGYLFSYFEYSGSDLEKDLHRLASRPENIRWRSIMKQMQLPFSDGDERVVWIPMEEVFYLE